MHIPEDVRNAIFLSPFKTRSAYMDYKSLEESTGEINAKYKLLTIHLAGVYYFHVLTKSRITYPTEYRLPILKEDWDSREKHSNGIHLDEPCSYLGCQHVDVMNEEKVKEKVGKTGFVIAGTLSQRKFTEVTDFIKRSTEVFSVRSNEEKRADIDMAWNKNIVSENIKKQLGI